jgi:hypothetical protein
MPNTFSDLKNYNFASFAAALLNMKPKKFAGTLSKMDYSGIYTKKSRQKL